MVKDPDTAKDILQECFLKIHKHLKNLKEEKSLNYWIYRITYNAIIDYFRSKRNTYEINENISVEEEQDYKTSQLAACIIPFIEHLPFIYKEALTLTEFQNYSQLELAAHLGISYSGAKSRVQRAKLKLKELFEMCCDISSDRYGNIIDYSPRRQKKCC